MIYSVQTRRDLLTTAIEGGINYWGGVERPYNAEEPEKNTFFQNDESEQPQTIGKLDLHKLDAAIEAVRLKRGYTREQMSDGTVDAGEADSIVQIALFGEEVYG